MANKTYSVTEGRARFCEMVKEAEATYDRFVLTKDGKPKAVLMSYEEYEGMLETIEIESDPKLAREILRRFEDIRKGKAKLVPLSEVKLRKR